jgi:hypothetical protein
MSDRASAELKAFAWPAYFVAALLVVTPLVDLVANVWPPRPGAVEWRFGTLGLLSGFLLTPLLGMVLATAAAALLEQRGAQRVLALLDLTGAALLLLVGATLSLDWLQMRASIDPATRPAIDIGSGKSIAKHVGVAIALAWLGVVGWRASRPSAHPRSHQPAPMFRSEG